MLVWAVFCALLLQTRLCIPISSDVVSEAKHFDTLVETSAQAFDDEDGLVGGFGVTEVPRAVPIQQPIATMIQEDEGSAEPCSDCILNKMLVPADFSGDLNELAEQAYSPTEEEREKFMLDQARRATKKGDIILEDEPPAQVLQYGMKPGDELVGGQGLVEATRPEDAEEEDGTQLNIELGEGQVPHGRSPVKGEGSEVAEVMHESDVLKKDLTVKDSLIDQLSDQLAKLQRTKDDVTSKLKHLMEEQDQAIAAAKQAGQESIENAKRSYEQRVSETRAEGTDRLKRVSHTEQHIQQRTATQTQLRLAELKQSFAQQMETAQHNADDLEHRVQAAEERRQQLLARDAAGKGEDDEAVRDGDGLRAQLTQARARLEELKAQEVALEDEERSVATHIRDEHAIRTQLEQRIQHLHRREAAIEEAERAMDAMNAGLKHEADEIEDVAEDDAEAVGHAREHVAQAVTEARTKAFDMMEQRKTRFERDTMSAVKDEIQRLKEELARRQRRESHAEEELIEQEREVRNEQSTADQTEQSARHQLQLGRAQVEEAIARTNVEAEAIVTEARDQSPRVFAAAKSEGLAMSQTDRDTLTAEIDALKHELADAEAVAKAKSKRLREESEETKRNAQHNAEQRLQHETEELKARLTKEAAKDLADFTRDESEQQTNADADLMMAQIRVSKDKAELKDVEASNEALKKAVASLQDRIKHEKQELEFQKLISAHPVGFSGEDQD